jgi:hypothetical protein
MSPGIHAGEGDQAGHETEAEPPRRWTISFCTN